MNKKTRQLKYQIVIIIILGVYLYYLVYRFRYTINPDALVLSISFLYADVHGFFSISLFAFQLWNPIERKPPAPPADASVDIYIPTYNEDVSIIRKTVLGCMNMRYPHKTYILDDGNRPELAKTAAEWGCGYIARKERSHAKAGNLNHALQRTNGEFLVIFDTDCVPQPDFLERTLGYFQDIKVAFVQTPHNYYNVDSFQFRVNVEKGRLWSEQNLFYRLIMPGRDYWNSAFFAGTAAVFRKKALQDIGGFATESITEDLHTTIRIYSHGWKGVYHNEILSNELAAKDLKNYNVQTLRWAEGNMSMLYKGNPLFTKGLTISQRICFTSTVFGWLFGFPKLIYLLLPIIGVFIGLNPIKSFDFPFIWRCSLFLIVLILGFEFITRGYGKIIFFECYTTLNFFNVIKAAFRSFFGLKSVFKVTKKSIGESVGIQDIAPQLIIGLLSFAGVIWGGLKLYYDFHSNFKGMTAAIFWNMANCLLVLSVIKKVTSPHYKRKEFRFIGALPVQFSLEDGTKSITGLGVTKDLNEYGISLVAFTPLPVGKDISLTLHLGQRFISCKGTVVHAIQADRFYGKVFVCSIRFDALDDEGTDLLCMYCFNTVLPQFRYRFVVRRYVFLSLLSKLYTRGQFRKHARRKTTLPVVIRNNVKAPITLVTNDVSSSGISVFSYVPLDLGVIIDLEVITPFGKLTAKGVTKQVKEIVSWNSYFIGIQFVEIPDSSKDILIRLVSKRQ